MTTMGSRTAGQPSAPFRPFEHLLRFDKGGSAPRQPNASVSQWSGDVGAALSSVNSWKFDLGMAPPCKGRFVYRCIEIRLQPPRRPDPPGTAGCLAIPRFCKRLFPYAFRDGALTPAIGGTLKDQDMISGTVKFYNTTNGFGFIAPDDGSKDPIVQAGAVERAGLSSLGEGQKISYDIENGPDGRMAAINLRLP